jgi:hypothetical protein
VFSGEGGEEESFREDRGLGGVGSGETDKEGVHWQDLDQKLLGGDWEQELKGRAENQEGLGGGCSLNKGKVGT